MGFFNSEKPPAKYSSSYIKMFAERIKTAVNYLSETNFPNGLSGVVLTDKTIPLTKLTQGEWQLPIIMNAQAYTTTSTSLVNVGGYVFWSTNSFPSGAKCYLEVTGGSGNASSTATFELHGIDGALVSVTSNKGSYEWLRSSAFTPPTKAQTLLLKMKTDNTSYAAGILSARIVIIL